MLCLLLYWFSNFCIHKITDMLTLCNCWEKVATPYNWSMPYLKWLTCPLYSRFLPRHPITKCLFESQMMPCKTPMDTSSQVQLTLAFLNYDTISVSSSITQSAEPCYENVTKWCTNGLLRPGSVVSISQSWEMCQTCFCELLSELRHEHYLMGGG